VVARGEVWWYEHPQAGRRPVLVLTRGEAIPVLNQVLAVPATTTVRGIPTEVPLGPDDGMPADCVLAVDNLTLVRQALCTDRIASLSPAKLRAVCDALALATAC
jgi:mRNA interferase MazF